MILLMAMMSSTSTAGVVGAMLADLVMVLTGLAATWTSGVPQVRWGGVQPGPEQQALGRILGPEWRLGMLLLMVTDQQQPEGPKGGGWGGDEQQQRCRVMRQRQLG
jgi:hypothetical protein